MTRSPLNGGRIVNARTGEVICEPKREKVAIVGAASLTRYLAPLDDPTWEIWAMNSMRHIGRSGLRADRCFEMHPLSIQSAADWDFLRDPPAPVYMFDVYPEVPLSVRFPMDRIEEAFDVGPGRPGDLFACTMAYQVALAILEGFKTIGFFGIELDRGLARERTIERTSVAWWCGFAQGRGVEVRLPFWSTLLTHPMRYGYDFPGEMNWVNRWLTEAIVYLREERRHQRAVCRNRASAARID